MIALNKRTPDKPANPLKSCLRSIIRIIRWHLSFPIINNNIIKGSNVYIGKHADIYIPNFAHFGNNISIGGQFTCQTNIIIGNDCLISSKVSFIGHDHDFSNKEFSAYFSGRKEPSTIILKGDNFIGFGSILLGNITIGKGSIVAAGSLVNKDIPPGVIYGGVPAKFIKNRFD
jgi:chloramphenicol O-acetyltransferase type B